VCCCLFLVIWVFCVPRYVVVVCTALTGCCCLYRVNRVLCVQIKQGVVVCVLTGDVPGYRRERGREDH
jgi:hypothetical protein